MKPQTGLTLGIIPLYWGTDSHGRLYIASEQKCLVDVCEVVEIFPPRMTYQGPPEMGKLKQWYFMDWVPQVGLFYVYSAKWNILTIDYQISQEIMQDL